jgi:hypothetical protein
MMMVVPMLKFIPLKAQAGFTGFESPSAVTADAIMTH